MHRAQRICVSAPYALSWRPICMYIYSISTKSNGTVTSFL